MRRKRLAAALLALLMLLCLPPVQAGAAGSFSETQEAPGPELLVKIPISTIRARCAGGTEYLDKFGVTRKKLLAELSAHEHDNYYLGTPQVGGDWQSPRGDAAYNGRPGMNCAGFVAYVLRKAGLDAAAATRTICQSPTALSWGSGKAWQYLSRASNYLSLVQYGKLVAHVYETKAALLASGECEKGDLIIRFWTDQFTGNDADNHLMIYWGNTPHEDKVWQNVVGGNSIGAIANTPASAFVLVKFAPEEPLPTFAGFTDVSEKDWFAGPVAFVQEMGYMQGVAKGRFDPGGALTRAQLVQIIYNIAGQPEARVTETPFQDVKGRWCAPAVAWAYGEGIVNGVAPGSFAPDRPITREQAAVMFMAYTASLNGLDGPPDAACLEAFADGGSVSSWAIEGVSWAVGYGLLSGKGAGILDPQGPCTRAQAACLAQNYFMPAKTP